MVTRGARGGQVRGVRKAVALCATSARSLMDRASDYGSEGWKFESSRARSSFPLGQPFPDCVVPGL